MRTEKLIQWIILVTIFAVKLVNIFKNSGRELADQHIIGAGMGIAGWLNTTFPVKSAIWVYPDHEEKWLIGNTNYFCRMIVLSDEKTFREIYDKYFSRMVVFAHTFLGAIPAAEDIVQDVFIKLHRLDNTFDKEAMLSAFLYKMVRNRAIDQLRMDKRTHGIKKQILETYTEEDLVNDELDGELIYMLAQSLNDLPPQSKKVITLLYENDFSYREVADALQISPATVKNMRKFALGLLKKKIDGKTPIQKKLRLLLALF